MSALRARLPVCSATIILLAGCGGGGSQTRTVTLHVLAASSLTESFTELGKEYETAHPQVKVAFDFESSSSLARKVVEGAPADVLATADESSMKTAVDASAVAGAAPVIVARNRLAIVVAPGNPKRVSGLADLGRTGVTFVLCAPQVPCGRLGALALTKAGIDGTRAASLEENVKGVLSKVVLGEADAGIVYVTDARSAGGAVTTVAVENAADPELQATYPVAVVKRSAQPRPAREWVRFVASPEGQAVFDRFGFQPP